MMNDLLNAYFELHDMLSDMEHQTALHGSL